MTAPVGTREPGPAPPRGSGRPDVAVVLTVYLLLLMAIPSRLVLGPLGAVGTPAAMLALGCGLWWLSSRVVPHLGGHVGRQPVRVALALFGTALLAGYAAGMLRAVTPVETRASDRFVLAMAGWIGVALLTADGVADRERLEALVRRLVWCAAALAVVGIVEFTLGIQVAKGIRVPGLHPSYPVEGIQSRAGLRRVAGTALHPIEFGVVLAMVLPLAVRHAHRGRGVLDRLPMLLIALALPMALSRSAVLATAVGFLVLSAGWTTRRRANALVSGGIFVAVLPVLLPGVLPALQGLFLHISEDPSTTTRTDDYSAVWSMVRVRPWFGSGTGTYVPELYRILDNQYLLTVVESGVVGVVTLFGVFLTAMTCARGARRVATDEATRELGQALAASVAVAGVVWVTFDAFSNPMASGVLFLLVGCCGALWRLEVTAADPARLERPAAARADG